MENKNATEVRGGRIFSFTGLLDLIQQGLSCAVPLTWQKDSFTCKDFSLWNKDHSRVNFPFFGNLLMAQDELSVRFCALFAVQPEETYVVEKCKSMN